MPEIDRCNIVAGSTSRKNGKNPHRPRRQAVAASRLRFRHVGWAMADGGVTYFVSWVPVDGDPFAAFGRRWTGWCPDHATAHERFSEAELSADLTDIARLPARRGFHGIVIPPFRIGPDSSSWAVEAALDTVSERSAAVRLPALRPAVVGDCLALVSDIPTMGLERLLGLARAELHGLIRPVAPAPRPRFHVPPASIRPSRELPSYESDRFHIPLTDPIGAERASELAGRIGPTLAQVASSRPQIADIALVGDAEGGRPAQVLARFPLRFEMTRDRQPLPAFGLRTDMPAFGDA